MVRTTTKHCMREQCDTLSLSLSLSLPFSLPLSPSFSLPLSLSLPTLGGSNGQEMKGGEEG